MATFVLIHGGGGTAWQWHLLDAELRERGHDVVAVDLPTEDPDAGLGDYADSTGSSRRTSCGRWRVRGWASRRTRSTAATA
jgi:hypothetical protein